MYECSDRVSIEYGGVALHYIYFVSLTLHCLLCVVCYRYFRNEQFSKKCFEESSDEHWKSPVAKKVFKIIHLLDRTDAGKENFWKKAYPKYVAEMRLKRNQLNSLIKTKVEGMWLCFL